jgi:hypothetical protein
VTGCLSFSVSPFPPVLRVRRTVSLWPVCAGSGEPTKSFICKNDDPQGLLLSMSMQPHTADTTCVAAGHAGTPHVFDHRTSSWACQLQSTGAAIRSVEWNPIIPHWISVGCDNGLVMVHDVRMPAQSQLLSFEGHHDAVLSVTWSSKHADLFCSGSADHTVKLWSMSAPAPHGVVATWTGDGTSWASAFGTGGPGRYSSDSLVRSPLQDSVVSVHFCTAPYGTAPQGSTPDLAADCFIVCADGQVASMAPTKDILEPLAETRLHSMEERTVERALYLREFNEATERVLRLSHQYLASGDAARAEVLMRLLEPQKALDAGICSQLVH